jgi:hypothetical protein
MSTSSGGMMISKGKAKMLTENLLLDNFVLRCENPASNYRSYGTAKALVVTNLYHMFNSLCFNNFPV